MIVKEFAGQADERISANYYGNVTKTARCITKILYIFNLLYPHVLVKSIWYSRTPVHHYFFSICFHITSLS